VIASPLIPNLKLLRLSGILDTLDVRTLQAIREQWTYEEFFTRLLQDEVERRAQKHLDLRLRRSGLTMTKTRSSSSSPQAWSIEMRALQPRWAV